MMQETEQIKARYEKRKNNPDYPGKNILFVEYVIKERESVYRKIIDDNFKTNRNLKILEIGAGEGANIKFFQTAGLKDGNIFASELLPERAKVLRDKFPGITVAEGDALQLNFDEQFDIVFQSLVFTSILDDDFKVKLAQKMWSMLKPGGIILWYDFRFNNPSNKDVKGVGKTEIMKLFASSAEIIFFNVTLAPPIGRRIGKLYNIINSVFPFLRTHIIACIKK